MWRGFWEEVGERIYRSLMAGGKKAGRKESAGTWHGRVELDISCWPVHVEGGLEGSDALVSWVVAEYC